MGNKTFDFSSKKKDFWHKNNQIWPKFGIFGQFGLGYAGIFSALLVGRMVVVACGLYLARHLFILCTRQRLFRCTFFQMEAPSSAVEQVRRGEVEEKYEPTCNKKIKYIPEEERVHSVQERPHKTLFSF